MTDPDLQCSRPLATNCNLKNALKTPSYFCCPHFSSLPTYPPTLHPLPVFYLLGDKYSCGHNQFPLLSELEAGQSGRLKCRMESRGRLVIAFCPFSNVPFIDIPDYWSTKGYYYFSYVAITSWLYIIHRTCNLNLERNGACTIPIDIIILLGKSQ